MPTSLRFTGTRILQSVNTTGGGNTTTVLNDATSFTWFQRVRIYGNSGENYVTELNPSTASGHLSSAGLYCGGSHTSFGFSFNVRVNNGSATEQVPLSLVPGTPMPTGGAFKTYTVCVTGEKTGGKWRIRGSVDGGAFGAYAESSAGYENFGNLGQPYRLKLGQDYDYGTGVTNDFAIDDLAIWKNRILSEVEVKAIADGATAPNALYASDQIVYLSGEGTLGANIQSGEAGRTNAGGSSLAGHFDTATTAFAGSGTATYGPSLERQAEVTIAAWIPESGKSIGFKFDAVPGKTFAPLGTLNAPYPDITTHPTIRVNGGSPVTLANPNYYKVDGVRYIYYPLTGTAGVLGSPIGPGDTVTFSAIKGWIAGLVDGSSSISAAYADEPATNRSGNPDSIAQALPGTRTLKASANLDRVHVDANWFVMGANAFFASGDTVLDARGEVEETGAAAAVNPFQRTAGNGTPAYTWDANHGPDVPLHSPATKAGRHRLEWEGAYTWGNANVNLRDTFVNGGNSLSRLTGPFANKPVTFYRIENVTPIENANGAGKHAVEFDISFISGTTGEATPLSVGGDDFVRPSRALDCAGFEWRCRGGGARKNIKLFAPGNIGRTRDLYTDTGLAAAKFEYLRHPPDTVNWHGTKNYTDLARVGDESRTFASYPDYKRKLTIASMTTPAPGNALWNLLPTGYAGTVLLITTSEPHGLTTGCGADIIEAADTISFTSGGWSGNAQWNGRWHAVQVIDATTLAIPYTPYFGDAPAQSQWALTNGTETTNAGKLGIQYIKRVSTTYKELAEAAAVGGSAPWFLISPGWTDAEIEAFLHHLDDVLAPGQKCVLEYANEVWNSSVFPACWLGLSVSQMMQGSGFTATATVSGGEVSAVTVTNPGSGYFSYHAGQPGHRGYYDLTFTGGGGTGAVWRAYFVDGACTSVVKISGGTGYTSAPTVGLPPHNGLFISGMTPLLAFYAVQCMRLKTISQRVWGDVGRNPADIKVATCWQFVIPGFSLDIARYMRDCGSPPDMVAGAPYTHLNIEWDHPEYWARPTQWRDLDIDQNFDHGEMVAAWMDIWGANIRAHRANLDSLGLTNVPYVCYEASVDTLIPGERVTATAYPPDTQQNKDLNNRYWSTARKMEHHPRVARIITALMKGFEANGLVGWSQFNYGGRSLEGVNGEYPIWAVCVPPQMVPGKGDGSDGLEDNRDDLLALERNVAPFIQAYADWNNGEEEPPPPPPPDPNLTHTVRNRRDVVWDTKMVTTAGARGSFSVLRAGGARAYQFTFPAGASDYAISAPFLASKLLGYAMAASKDATIKTNSTSTPDNTFLLKANSPDLWRYDWTAANPFEADVATFYVTCPSGTEFKLLILVDPT
jgi:hypothetical protein